MSSQIKREQVEKLRKSRFFTCFARFAAIYSEHQPLVKTWGTCSGKNKKQHGLIRFSFAWKLFCNDLEVNRARGDREIRLWKMSGGAPSFWLEPGSIPWTPKNARERSQERQFSFSAVALLTTPQKHLRIASYKLWRGQSGTWWLRN